MPVKIKSFIPSTFFHCAAPISGKNKVGKLRP